MGSSFGSKSYEERYHKHLKELSMENEELREDLEILVKKNFEIMDELRACHKERNLER